MAEQNRPKVSDETIAALKVRYRAERDRRLRPDGDRQYVEVAGEFADYYETDPYSPPVEREPVTSQIDVAILGGGFAGLLAGANLRTAGINDFRIIEMGGDFGGTWYWNRYPGVQCDIESYCYMPLLEELNYVPKEKYSFGPEIFAHCRAIGRHFHLYENALFGTIVRALRWDDVIKRWHITTNRGDAIRARFLIMATGPFNRPKLPGIPGMKEFHGHSFHTSRWDYAYTGGNPEGGGLVNLKDKRVAVIGTGATGVQVIPKVAEYAKHMYVFQRTPSAVDVRGNKPTDPEWAKSLGAGWQRARQHNFNAMMWGSSPPAEVDLVGDGWTEINRNLLREFHALVKGELGAEEFAKLMEREDFEIMERLRGRVEQTVKNANAVSALKAWYRFNCKRPTFSDDFLPAFNRENVTLVDVSASRGVERITEKGLVANGEQYEVDCIIYASGFEITTEIKRRFGIPVIQGRHGKSLYDHWKEGFRTFHGFMAHGFPNQFFTGFTQVGVSANMTAMFDEQTTHIAYIIKAALDRGVSAVEPTAEAEQSWIDTIRTSSISRREFLQECTPGVFNTEGGPVMRSYIGEFYGAGINAFNALLRNWREQHELQGLRLER